MDGPTDVPLPDLRSLQAGDDFADRCARLALERYFQLCGRHALSARGQVVLAAMLAQEHPHDLWVVALGVGTKFMPADAVKADQGHERVRDSHAEVLARRGFMHYLYKEVQALVGLSSMPVRLLQAAASGDSFELKEGLSLHLYVSTAPCGWASGSNKRCKRGLKRLKVPELLVKGAGDSEAPVGCVFASDLSLSDVSLSCSDKVARWQFQGLEGLLLASVVRGPLRLSTITIGRKFDHASCVLALGWASVAILRSTLSLEAALALAKSQNLGASAPESEKGDGDESYVWSLGDVQAAMHDGRTGAALDSRGASRQAAPAVAGSRFLQLYNSLPLALGEAEGCRIPRLQGFKELEA